MNVFMHVSVSGIRLIRSLAEPVCMHGLVSICVYVSVYVGMCVPLSPYRFSLQPLSTSNLFNTMSQPIACCTSNKCNYSAVVCVCEGHSTNYLCYLKFMYPN